MNDTTEERGYCHICGTWNSPENKVCNCVDVRHASDITPYTVKNGFSKEEWIAASSKLPPYSCTCAPKETCTICKEAKLADGIGPKYDTGKLRYSLVPPIIGRQLAEVLTFGATKYAPNSWQNVPNAKERYLDALIRHLESYRAGELLDPDSNLPHLAHLACNLAFIMHFEEHQKGNQ